jgi:predicted phosphodiesterase
MRVAVLSDVHANATALEAVLEELKGESVDRIVFGGDLTWGPLPRETLVLVRSLGSRALFVRGNADREVVRVNDLLAEETEKARADADLFTVSSARARWLVAQHDPVDRAFLASFAERLTLDVDGLGPTLFCHGSPRSDEEIVTDLTPDERMAALLEGVEERVVVTAHVHIQFDRVVHGVRSINAGSVGMPYEGRPGAYWAILGPAVEFRRTEYDLEEAVRRYEASGDPLTEEMVKILREPPTREEVIAEGEKLEFSG